MSASSTTNKSIRGSLVSFLEWRMFGICAFYLWVLVFFPILIPYSVYQALWCGSIFCQVIWLLVVVDFLIPLKMPGLWVKWCIFTDDSANKKRYFDAEIVSEFFVGEKGEDPKMEVEEFPINPIPMRIINRILTTRKNDDNPVFARRKAVVENKNYFLIYHPHALFGIGHPLIVKYFFENCGAEPLFTGADVIQNFPFLMRRKLSCFWTTYLISFSFSDS